jgi:transposase
VESAGGLGKLLAQQLVEAGKHVVDVPPTLAARVRLLGSAKASKSDPNNALATAIAGLGHCGLRAVRMEDHTAVLRMLIDRHDDLAALRTQATCRLHVALRELIAGGAPRRLGASRATKLLRNIHPQGAAGVEHKRLALELLADVGRLDRDIAAAKRRVSDAVTASGTALLELHGVGPIVAGCILGHVGDPARFPTPGRFASYNGTAPIEASSGPRTRHRLNPRGNRKLNHALHMAAVTQVRHDTPGPGLLPPQDRRGEVEEGSTARPGASDQRRRLAPAPGRPRSPLTTRAREDNQGRLFNPAWPAEPRLRAITSMDSPVR